MTREYKLRISNHDHASGKIFSKKTSYSRKNDQERSLIILPLKTKIGKHDQGITMKKHSPKR